MKMGKVAEISYNKILSNCLNAIRQNQNLCKLLFYDSSDDPLNEPDIEDTTILSKKTDEHEKHIFRSPTFLPEAIETKTCMLSLTIKNSKNSEGNNYKDVYIRILCSCHLDITELDNGSRTLLIMEELEKIFQNKKPIDTLGKSLGGEIQECHFSNKFHGYETVYKVTDFA